MKFPHRFTVRRRREPYPSAHLWLRLLDRLVMTVGILGPLFTLPQILLIYQTQQAAGVSALSWAVFALFDLPWILYGFAHRERPIVYTYLLWFIANGMVAVGAILYG